MSRSTRLFALLAIMPAALHAAPVRADASLLVPICTGDGQARLIAIPKGGEDPGKDGGGQSCAKGCHGGSPRKRGALLFLELAQ
jgi:hypothetical protein